jgi:hypothetical protein
MNYKITLLSTLLAILIFTGCNNETSYTEKNLENITQAKLPPALKKLQNSQQPIVGIWLGDCHYEESDDESYQAELTFNLDASYSYIEKTYPTHNCSEDYTILHEDIGTYSLGDKTKASDGKSAYEFEIHTLEEGVMNDEYFMLRLTDKTLIFTDEKDDNSQPNGETPQTRNNFFSHNPKIKFTKQTIITQ